MKTRIALFAALLLLAATTTRTFAQESGDLLDLVKDTTQETEYVNNAFKSTRVINGQSIEMLGAGTLDFRILHRFGAIKTGVDGLWGLDQSTMRFSFDWVPITDLQVGVGRSTANREYDALVKYRLLHQSTGARNMPVSVVLDAGVTCWTGPWTDPTRPNYFSSRLSYYQQVLVGSKLSEELSLQISPTLIHRNLVPTAGDPNDIFALGFGGRFKLTNRIAFVVDYYHAFNGMVKDLNYDPLSIGFDIETGGHVFQLHITNTKGMNERAFVTETYQNFFKGDIQFGFNISRVFQL